MGYTHYITRKEKELDQETWGRFIKDCKILVKNMPATSLGSAGNDESSPLHLTGCGAFKLPQFSKHRVYFNGGHPDSKRIKKKNEHQGKEYTYWEDEPSHGLDHETFVIQRKYPKDNRSYTTPNEYFAFCKTARKPYDLMVCAVLILYKLHFQDRVSVCSDGDFEDWAPALNFVLKHIPSLHETILETLLQEKFMAWLENAA